MTTLAIYKHTLSNFQESQIEIESFAAKLPPAKSVIVYAQPPCTAAQAHRLAMQHGGVFLRTEQHIYHVDRSIYLSYTT